MEAALQMGMSVEVVLNYEQLFTYNGSLQPALVDTNDILSRIEV